MSMHVIIFLPGILYLCFLYTSSKLNYKESLTECISYPLGYIIKQIGEVISQTYFDKLIFFLCPMERVILIHGKQIQLNRQIRLKNSLVIVQRRKKKTTIFIFFFI